MGVSPLSCRPIFFFIENFTHNGSATKPKPCVELYLNLSGKIGEPPKADSLSRFWSVMGRLFSVRTHTPVRSEPTPASVKAHRRNGRRKWLS
jgi:hypothetical protein